MNEKLMMHIHHIQVPLRFSSFCTLPLSASPRGRSTPPTPGRVYHSLPLHVASFSSAENKSKCRYTIIITITNFHNKKFINHFPQYFYTQNCEKFANYGMQNFNMLQIIDQWTGVIKYPYLGGPHKITLYLLLPFQQYQMKDEG